jgi:hypothetical protein
MAEVLEYPKWVKVEGKGNPLQPGYELVNSKEEEAALAPPKTNKKSKADDN